MSDLKHIRDAIHGDLEFSDLELQLMDTAAMQRLRGIRQLGASYLVYPAAQHTRFEHSLGTCMMAKKILHALETQTRLKVTKDEQKAIAAAALLHDVTHIPFGHTLEDERRIFPRHDKDPKRVEFFIHHSPIGKLLQRHKILHRVVALLSEKQAAPDGSTWAGQVISHTICADLLDYLRRDARFCGLNIDYDDRIFRYFTIEDGRLVLNLQKNGLFRHDAFSEVIHLLRIRYFLTERVYYHHAKIAAGAMLSRAVERAVELGFDTERLFSMSDEALLYVLQTEFGKDMAIHRLISHYMSRSLYKRCFVLTEHTLSEAERLKISQTYHDNVRNHRGVMERRIAREAKIPPEAVIIYAPPPKMNLKEADVLVKVDRRPARPLGDYRNHEVMSLQEKYGKLWKLYVFVDSEFAQRYAVIGAICEKHLQYTNDLPLIQKGQLSLFATEEN
ncbi:HD domain-containing protein [bacterium]|nr:HD domain-containing protein [candidate division CSSED10-310 bacterium]